MSIEAIKQAAISRIGDLVLVGELGLSDGRRERIHWVCRNPQRADKQLGSFKVVLEGGYRGTFKDFASDHGGDVIDLVSYCLSGPATYQSREARGRAIGWLANWTGLDDAPARRLTDEERAAREQKIAVERAAREAEQAEADAARGRKAKGWWLSAEAKLSGTPVEKYLETVRGISLGFLPLTGAIRALGPNGGRPHWAMFCAMARDGDIRAVHMTFLTPDGQKADVDPVKKIWGDKRGAVIRVSKGALDMSPEAAARAGKQGTVAISEGVEDALTLAMIHPDWMCWAAGDVGNMAAIVERSGWPACASEIVLLADNDAPGSPAAEAFDKASRRWLEASEGRPVRTLRAQGAKDLNDMWRAMG